MTKRATSLVDKDQTRECFDPWSFVQIRAKGDVLPCCLHPRVGRLSEETTLNEVLTGDEIRKIRFSLIAGKLDSDCTACQNRSTVNIRDFRRQHAVRYLLKGKKLTADGSIDLAAHPEMRPSVEFSNVKENHYGLRDRVFLHPSAGRKRPTVTFKKFQVSEPSDLDLFLDLDHDEALGVQFHVEYSCRTSFGNRWRHRHTRTLAQRHDRWTLPCPFVDKPFDVSFSVSAKSLAYAWFHFSYPFFVPHR